MMKDHNDSLLEFHSFVIIQYSFLGINFGNIYAK